MRRLLALALAALALAGAAQAQTTSTPDSRVRGGLVAHSGQFRVDGRGNVAWNGTQAEDNIKSFGASVNASAPVNTAAIQAAINDAETFHRRLRIPADGTGCYNYVPPLTINAHLDIIGDYVADNYSGSSNIEFPTGTPTLLGSVLCPTSNGSDAIDITGTALHVNIEHLGINFGTAFSGTGDAINYVPGTGVAGLMASTIRDVRIVGHDGNHYAFDFKNAAYSLFEDTWAYGGGGYKFSADGSTTNFANLQFIHAYCRVIVGGSSNGWDLSANAVGRLGIINMLQPKCSTETVSGITPGGNPPTSSQYMFKVDTNINNLNLWGPVFETTVSSKLQLGATAQQNEYDFPSMFTNTAAIEAPAWATTGLVMPGFVYTLTDTTSTGTVAIQAAYAIDGPILKASNAVTEPVTTLIVTPPTCSTNVTCSNTDAIYAGGGGSIAAEGNLSANAGLFINGGNVTIDANTGATAIQMGTFNTSGGITIGGASNTVAIGSPLTLSLLTSCVELKTSGAGLASCVAANTVSGVSGTGLGTTPSVTATADGLGMAMDITVGTSPAAANFTITFGTAAAHGWVCDGADITTNSTSVSQLKQFGTGSTTTCTMEMFSDIAVAAAMTAADHVRVMARPY